MGSYYQLVVRAEFEDASELVELMESMGALSITIESDDAEESYDIAEPGDPDWSEQRITGLFSSSDGCLLTANQVQKSLPECDVLQTGEIPDQDWERSWLDRFKPFQIRNALWICPTWCDKPETDQPVLIIDPGLAFGTGTHETTQLCLEALTSTKLKNRSVIDYGCGSGILGIAAALLDANQVVGVDVDHRAIETSIANAQLNGVSEQFSASLTEQCNLEAADIVIANILAGTIMSLSSTLNDLVNENGLLILSGILNTQIDEVLLHFSDFDFTVKTENKWCMAVGKRT